MSHLTILPTVLRDVDLLISTLEALQLSPQRGGKVSGFAGDMHPVDVQIFLADDLCLGWRQQADGSLALVGDLERLSRSTPLSQLLGTINRTYAAHLALREASTHLPGAVLDFVR